RHGTRTPCALFSTVSNGRSGVNSGHAESALNEIAKKRCAGMKTKLIADAVALLRKQLDVGAAAERFSDTGRFADIAALIHAYPLAESRKQTILACCILIVSALARHGELTVNDN